MNAIPFNAAKRTKAAMSLAVLFAFGLSAMVPVAARSGEMVGDVIISVEPVPNLDNRSGSVRGTEHGYVEYRVQLKNGSAREQIVYLSYPPIRSDSFSRVTATRAVRIAKEQEVSLSLFQPPIQPAGSALEVRVEGVEKPKIIPVSQLHDPGFGRAGYGAESATPTVVLLSRSVPQDFCDPATASRTPGGPPATTAATKKGTPPPEYEPTSAIFTFLRSEVPVSRWSPNWLGYSCYDAIVLTEQEAGEMPPQSQLAIRRFVECGGSLFIHGRRVPAVFSSGGFAEGRQNYSVGFGHVVATLTGRKDVKQWRQTYAKLVKTPIAIYDPVTNPGNGAKLLITESTVPVKGLFLLVLVFGLGIGPANLWLLTRHKRRIWLWWNVPLISLLTCLVVFGYSIASEGWIGHEKNASFTLLDERCHRATTLGYLSFYCPLTPSVGPRFSMETDVALLQQASRGYDRYGRYGQQLDTLKTVDWTTGQELTSGWITARVATYFQFRKNEDRRERLTVEKQSDGTLKIVNALGANIHRLYLADASGRVYEGRNIPAGAERTLSAAGGARSTGAIPTSLHNIFTSEWLASISSTLDKALNPADSLIPGSYIAILDKSPFLETTMTGVQSEDTAAVVYGISKGQE